MPWIRFTAIDFLSPAPMLKLLDRHGMVVDTFDYREKTNLVICFLPSKGEARNCEIFHQIDVFHQEGKSLEAVILIVLPSDISPRKLHVGESIQVLFEPDGRARRRYAELLEFDTQEQPLLFVLDRFGMPYAAWVGTFEDGLPPLKEIQDWLDYIDIQCPE